MTQPFTYRPQVHAGTARDGDESSEYMAMASQHVIKSPDQLSQQQQAVGNAYTDHPVQSKGALPNIGGLTLQANPAYGTRDDDQRLGVQNSSPPPLPPKPPPKQAKDVPLRPPVGTQHGAPPSRPPVGIQHGAVHARPPVGTQHGAVHARPPVGTQHGAVHARPLVGIQHGAVHVRPPVGIQHGAVHVRPPVGTQHGAPPSRPPVGTQHGAPPSRPPNVRENAAEKPKTHQPWPSVGPPANVPPSNSPPPNLPPQRPPQSTPVAVQQAEVDAHEYTYVHNTKDQMIQFLQSRVSDLESQLKERQLQLSRCNDELSKSWRCVAEKKEELKRKNLEIQRLGEEIEALRQSSRNTPQVAQTEATLQSQVTHYRKIVDDLTATVEQLRRQPPVPTIDTQEIGRLRREVQWHQEERQRMSRDIEALKASEHVLSAQTTTYKEDFASEREDRERAQAKIEELKAERDSLNHIITLLGGQQQAQGGRPP